MSAERVTLSDPSIRAEALERSRARRADDVELRAAVEEMAELVEAAAKELRRRGNPVSAAAMEEAAARARATLVAARGRSVP